MYTYLSCLIKTAGKSCHLLKGISMSNNALVNCPAVPIPPGVSRSFAHVFIQGVGHLRFCHYLGAGHLPTLSRTWGHFDTLVVLVTHDSKRQTCCYSLSYFITFCLKIMWIK